MTLVMAASAVGHSLAPRRDATVPVTVFGSWRDAQSWRARLWLTRAGFDHDYVDVSHHRDVPGSHLRRLPAIRIDGEWLTSPSRDMLHDALARHGFPDVSRRRTG